jgi:integrase
VGEAGRDHQAEDRTRGPAVGRGKATVADRGSKRGSVGRAVELTRLMIALAGYRDQQAANIVLNQLYVAGAEYVFPRRRGAGHRVDIKKPWGAICKSANIGGLRIHDLRHSYASMLVSGGQSLPVIGALLGHTQPNTTARYAHLMDDPLRKATETVGAIIDGAGKPGAEVVKLRR